MKGHKFGIPLPDVQTKEKPWVQRRDGKSASNTDPDRRIWYGPCMYWTDDWNQVALSPIGNIPCCPRCGAVGFEMSFREWIDGAERFAAETAQLGYTTWLLSVKETCSPDMSQWKTRSEVAKSG